jgi:hypothetical protein
MTSGSTTSRAGEKGWRDIESRGRGFDPQRFGPASQTDQNLQAAPVWKRATKIQQAAMFRADSRASQLSARLTTAFGAGLILLLGSASRWRGRWPGKSPGPHGAG